MLAHTFSLDSFTARSRRVFAGRMLSFCFAGVAVLATIARAETPIEPELAKMLASDAAAGDRFGFSIAADGDTVVVGAPFGGPAGMSTGAAYVYQRDPATGAWTEMRKLVPSDFGSDFGISVAIAGDTVLVGSRGAQSQGAAYVFGRNAGGPESWGEVKKLTANDGANSDQFGSAVALSGHTALVGSPQDDDAGSASGSAYVFERNQGGPDAWGQVRKLVASDAAEGDLFGTSVALQGDTAVVGAFGNDDGGSQSGSAYVFERNLGGAGQWGERRKLTASNAAENDSFGRSVAVWGDSVMVGAEAASGTVLTGGAVYAFERHEGGLDQWGEVRMLTNSDATTTSDFGYSLALEGNFVVIGSPGHNQAGHFSGVAYVFSRQGGAAGDWVEQWKLAPTDLATGDQLGLGVALRNGRIAVGAWAHVEPAGATGSAYVFRAPAIFLDGFESGDTSAWSLTVP